MVIQWGDVKNLPGAHPKPHEVRGELISHKEVSDIQPDIFNQLLQALDQMAEGRRSKDHRLNHPEKMRKNMPRYEAKNQTPEKSERKGSYTQSTEKKSRNDRPQHSDTTTLKPENALYVLDVTNIQFDPTCAPFTASTHPDALACMVMSDKEGLNSTSALLGEHSQAKRSMPHTLHFMMHDAEEEAAEHLFSKQGVDDALKDVIFERVSAPLNYQGTDTSSISQAMYALQKIGAASQVGTDSSEHNILVQIPSADTHGSDTSHIAPAHMSHPTIAAGVMSVSPANVLTEEKVQQGTAHTLSTTLTAAGLSAGTSQGGTQVGKMQMPRQAVSQAERAQAMIDMGEKFKSLLQRGETHMKIHLTPQSLGKIEIRLDINRLGQAQAFFMTDYRDTMSLLTQYTHEMEKIFQEAGLQADSSDFNYGSHEDSPGESGQNPTERMLNDVQNLLSQDPEILLKENYPTLTGATGMAAVNIQV